MGVPPPFHFQPICCFFQRICCYWSFQPVSCSFRLIWCSLSTYLLLLPNYVLFLACSSVRFLVAIRIGVGAMPPPKKTHTRASNRLRGVVLLFSPSPLSKAVELSAEQKLRPSQSPTCSNPRYATATGSSWPSWPHSMPDWPADQSPPPNRPR